MKAVKVSSPCDPFRGRSDMFTGAVRTRSFVEGLTDLVVIVVVLVLVGAWLLLCACQEVVSVSLLWLPSRRRILSPRETVELRLLEDDMMIRWHPFIED